MMSARRVVRLRDVLLTTTALVAALAGGAKEAAAGSSSSGLSGFNVVSGGATLSTPSSTTSVINQTTNKAIINWSAFGIPAGSTVQFVQPGASSVALNRVTGGNVSNIMGSLLANGQVWIVNPAGVFFGPGAQVDVAGLMATTSDIKNADFLSGNYQFGITSPNPNASVVNQGTIMVSSGGAVVLAGARVDNQGLIQAHLGTVALGGGSTFAVDFSGDKLLSFQVTGAVSQTPTNGDGTPAAALVTNSGTISASGGTVLLTARAAKNVIDNVINSSGIVEATSAQSVNGEIVLDGGDNGVVTVSGALNSSGKGSGETGGTVKVLGDQINLASGANIDVSGDAGGGTALVGGNFHGAGPEQNASVTVISSNATINADAISTGNGGKVAVWSQQYTALYGTISARGGTLGGNGGFIETSSANILQALGNVNVGPQSLTGIGGTWLLDPANVTIQANSGTITSGTFSSGTFTPGTSATDSIIDPSVINNALDSGGTVLINANGNAAAGAGNILIDANLTLSQNNKTSSLIFSAGSSSGSITLGANETISATGNSDTLNVSFIAGASGSITLGANSGIFVNQSQQGENGNNKSLINATFNATGGSITIGDGSTMSTDGGNLSFLGPAIIGDPGTSGSVLLSTSPTKPATDSLTGGTISFSSTVTSAGDATITFDAQGGALVVDGAISGFAALNFNVGLLSVLGTLNSGTGALTVGTINVGAGNLTLEGDTISLVGGPDSVTGSGTLTIEPFTSSRDMLVGGTVNPGTGTLWISETSLTAITPGWSSEIFGRPDGSGTLTVNAVHTFLDSTTFMEGAGTVVVAGTLTGGSSTGSPLVLDPAVVDINANIVTTGAAIVIEGTAVIGANVTVSSGGGAIDFTSTVDSKANTSETLSLNSGTGNVTLAGAVGASTAMGALLVSGTGTTTLSGGSIATTTAHSASGTVSVAESVLLTTNETVTSAGGSISLTGPVNGAFGLSLSATSGAVTLGNVGASTALDNILVTSASVTLQGTTYTTAQDQIYSGPVTLASDATLTSVHDDVTISGTVDGAHALSISASSGTIGIGGLVGGVNPLASLAANAKTVGLSGVGSSASDGVTGTVSVTGSTLITLNGSAYHSGGSESFSGPVRLLHDETITSDSGDVRFVGTTSTIDGGFALALTAAASGGTVSLGGSVGAATALTSLLIDPATIALGGSTYHTSQGQTYSVGVSLGADATLISDHGSIAFLGSVDGAHSLGISAVSGSASLGSAVGAGAELASLTVTADSISVGGSGGSVVHTSGGQSFSGPLTLQHDETLTSDASTITFTNKVDGAFGLTASAVLTTFEGAVGSTLALTSLTVTGTADLNGGSIRTTGTQSYNGPVTLSTDDTLSSTAGNIAFGSSIDSIGGAHLLSATASAGTLSVAGDIGGGTALSGLTLSGSTVSLSGIDHSGSAGVAGGVSITGTALIDLGGSAYHAGGSETFAGPVVLLNNETITSDTSSLSFTKTVDGAFGLTAAAVVTTFGGTVGFASPLASLTVTGTADLNGGSITTSGAQDYKGPVVLGTNNQLTASAITFENKVDGSFGLIATATGLTTFDGVVGGTTPLSSLTVTHGADLNGGTITTTGAQNYDGPVILTADALLTGTAITFLSTVDGAHELTATATGLTSFDGVVGGATPLSSLTVTNAADLNGGTITTTGAQNYDGPVILTADALLKGTAITFLSTVDGTFGLTATATGLTTFEGAIGSSTQLTSVTVTNAADLNGGSVKTTGAQSYDGAVTLSADVTLTSVSGNVTFGSTVDGAQALSVSATSGTIGAGGLIGGLTALSSVTMGAKTITLSGIDHSGSAGVTGTVALTAPTLITLDGTAYHSGSDQTYSGPVVLGNNESLTSDSGSVTFTNKVDGAFGLTVTAAVLTTFEGAVGSSSPLASLTITDAADLNGGTIKTTGAQSYDGAVTLTSDATLTGSTISFESTVDGAHALVATATGLTTFEGAVGGTTRLASLTVTNAADLNGGSVKTTGTQTYGGPVTLSEDATLASTSGNIAFSSTVDGAHLLSATASAGTVSVGGIIGGATALSGLTLSGSTVALSGIDHSGSAGVTGAVLVTATGTVTLAGAAYHSGGDQTFTGPVVLLHDEVVTSDTGGLSFGGPINGAHALSLLATSGIVTLGSVGTTQALTSLLVDPVGIVLNGTVYHTTGAQSYLEAVTLGADATLTSDTGSVTLASTVNGAHALSISATSGSVGVGGLIGGTSALTSLTLSGTTVTLSGIGTIGTAGVTGAASITGSGRIVENGTAYHTGGALRFAGPVVLGADETVISDTSNVTFTTTVNGAHALSVTATSGSIGAGGVIGGTTALTSLAIDGTTVTLSGVGSTGAAGATGTVDVTAASLITLGGTAYHSGGDQTYTGTVVLAGNETVTSDTGNIGFGGPINGGFTLSVSASSGMVSLGNVGTTTALAALAVDPAGITLDGTTYHTTGSQSYLAAVTLAADATLTSNTGNVTFTNTIDGAHALSVAATSGTVGVGGVIGGVSALTSLAINGGSGVHVTSVHTNGSQSYTSGNTVTIGGLYDTGNGSITANGAVSLASATTINPGSGTLTVSGALTGSANLTILGSGVDTLASMNINTGTLDLSGKSGGSFTVNGVADAAALVTGTNPYSLALLGGGNIGDPTLANTGGDTLAGSFVFADGLSVLGTLTLGGNTTLNTETSGITLGAVQQGSNTFIVIADAVTLNGDWTGTGPRGLTPFSSSLSIGLGSGAPGSWTLTSQELQYIGDPPVFVVIGGGTAIGQEIQDIGGSNTAFIPNNPPGPINVGTFTFDAPLYLIGSAIVIDGTLTKNAGGVGFITPGSISGPGSLDLGPGTGILAIAADSANLNGTVNGSGGSAAAGETELVGTPGSGPYLINGVCFGGAGCGTPPPPNGPDITLLGSTILYTNDLNGNQGPPPPPGGSTDGTSNGSGDTLGGISPSGGPGSDTNAPTDAAVDALGGPLNSKPPTQAQPRGYYVSLLGGMLLEWRDLGNRGNTVPEENTDFSGQGDEWGW